LKKYLTQRVSGVRPFLGRVMFDKAKALEHKGERLIHFEIGEPDFETPQHVKDAAKRAIDEGYTHYAPNAGLLELREAISEKLAKDNGIKADPATQICVTVGSVEAAFLAIMCTIEPGDQVLIPEPGYYAYRNCVEFAGGKPVSIPLTKETDFRLDPEELEKSATPKCRMIVLNSPSNPIGSVFTKSDLETVDEFARKHDIFVLADEIYEKIIYDGYRHWSIAALSKDPDRVITVNGFSKAYAMTGWRIGYVVASKILVSEIVKIQQSAVSSATTFAQKGAVEALRGPQEPMIKMVEEFSRRREVIIERLNEVKGFSVAKPRGAFYAFVNIEKLKMPSQELCEYLLNEAKVVTTPGIAFGQGGEGYVRFSYATSIENIIEGLDSIKKTMRNL